MHRQLILHFLVVSYRCKLYNIIQKDYLDCFFVYKIVYMLCLANFRTQTVKHSTKFLCSLDIVEAKISNHVFNARGGGGTPI